MGWLEAIVIFIKLILALINIKMEKDKEIKVKKEAALKEVQNGFKTNDVSAITAGFAELNSL